MKQLVERYPQLESCQRDMEMAFSIMKDSFQSGGKLLVCGNGGSAADCSHIAGELLKGFLKKRRLAEELRDTWTLAVPDGRFLHENLQGALPVISLPEQLSFSKAFANDVRGDLNYAQLVYAYGREGDVLLALSTSGNSENIKYALETAKVLGLKNIGLSGMGNGKIKEFCDVYVQAPSLCTPEIQEYHLAVYHTLCRWLEEEFFL